MQKNASCDKSRPSGRWKNLVLLAVLAMAGTALYGFGLIDYITPDFFFSQQQAHPQRTTLVFFGLYVLITALSLPLAAVMTLLSGALFGFTKGLLIVSFASTLGAGLAMLTARTLLRDWVQARFDRLLGKINTGMEQDGAFYLFSLRLMPVIPFAVVNLVMGLTRIRLWTFCWVSQLGMLAGTAVYINAGSQLKTIDSLSAQHLLTPGLLLSLVLMAAFPWLARALLRGWKLRSLYKGFKKPARFDTNIAVIGAGSGGLVSAYIAAAVKARVTLIEREKMGGDCLNTGCVPSKALIRSSRINHLISRAREFGLEVKDSAVNFRAVMERVQKVIGQIEPHDSVERYTGLGVDCLQGEARLVSPWEVSTGERTITARNIIIASGGRPVVPPFPGLDQVNYHTSDSIWSLRDKPDNLLVLGGGPIGCELAQAFGRLGVQVTQIDLADRLLSREDEDVSEVITRRFERDGIRVLTQCKASSFHREGDSQWLEAEHQGQTIKLHFDVVLLALGRKANTQTLGLDSLDLETRPDGTLAVNDWLQTRYPNIYACGDVAGPWQFTHAAAHQAWYATVNALFGRFKKFKVDYSVIPRATFLDPEVARVGLNEQEAREQGIACEVTRFEMHELDRALADGSTEGFVKVLTVPGKDRILGCTIVADHAGELLTEYVTAMKHGLGLNKILGTIHAYPTLSEANKYAAGVWKRAHVPHRLLAFLEKFHRWHR